MSGLISRSALIEALNKFENDTHESAECYASIAEIVEVIEYIGILIDEQPIVEAKPVVHGEWISFDEEANGWQCSRCGNVWQLNSGTPKENNMNFCTNCGARMVKEHEENK